MIGGGPKPLGVELSAPDAGVPAFAEGVGAGVAFGVDFALGSALDLSYFLGTGATSASPSAFFFKFFSKVALGCASMQS